MTRTRAAVLALLLPLALAGCGTAAPRGHRTVLASTGRAPVSYARHLLSLVRLPRGGTAVAKSPVVGLRRPFDVPSFGASMIRLSRWWTYDAPADSVLAFVRAHEGPALSWQGSLDGGGGPSGSGPFPSGLEFQPSSSLPPSVGYGDVEAMVESMGADRSGLALFARVEAQPRRPAAEQVPTTGVSAVVGWRIAPGGTPAEKPLSGAAAARLARDFDRLPRNLGGVHGCPAMVPENVVTVVVRSGADTWRVTLDGCDDVDVRRDGVALPALTLSTAEATAHGRGVGQPFLADLKAAGARLPWQRETPLGGDTPLASPGSGG